MGVNKIAIGISIGLLALVGAIYYVAGDPVSDDPFSGHQGSSAEVKIEQAWELPEILAEISAIAFQEEDKIVGVQDEQGKLFIYNLQSSEIEKEIDFAGPGDYEGLALDGSTAYILRSDGTIFQIENYIQEPKVTELSTFLTEDEDTEGLCLDKKNNRLLVAIKSDDPKLDTSKGIYAFSLSTMKMSEEPVYEIDLKDPVFQELEEEDPQDLFKPSEINIHPETGEIYVLEGQNPKLLILTPEGEISQLYTLDKKDFSQPEGLSFDSSGELFISNEGSPATIYKIGLN